MNALIYLRVSTDKQAEKGFSIPAQRSACLAYAEQHGYAVVAEYLDEGESARYANRNQLQEMLVRTKAGDVDAIIVHKVDRLARSVYDHTSIKFLLKENGTRLLSVTENIDDSPEGEVLEGMMVVLAQYYSRNLGREVSKGMNRRAQIGLWNGKAPLGYKNMVEVRDAKVTKKWVELDPKTSPLVKKLFTLFASGNYSTIGLASWAEKNSLTSNKGKQLSPSVICRMLKKRFYIGKIEWGKIEVQGQHEPLVDIVTFERVQNVLVEHVNGRDRQKKYVYILRGPSTCGECGSKITAEMHNTSSGRSISTIDVLNALKTVLWLANSPTLNK